MSDELAWDGETLDEYRRWTTGETVIAARITRPAIDAGKWLVLDSAPETLAAIDAAWPELPLDQAGRLPRGRLSRVPAEEFEALYELVG